MSNKTKHTKGKWYICHKTETQIFIAATDDAARIVERKGSYICEIKQAMAHHGINKHDQANAKLIAAAPDLLEALTAMIDGKERDFSKLSEKALAAIKKATK